MSDLMRIIVLMRGRWWYVVMPAIVLAATGIWPLVHMTPQYRVSVTVLLTSRAPMNDTGDTLAYDFPAVSRGDAFRQKVSTYLDNAVAADEIGAMLDVRNDAREVTIIARGTDMTRLVLVRDAALAVLTQDGTLLWGKSGDTAVNIAKLRSEDIPVSERPWVNQIAQIVLRAVAGLLVGIMVVVYRR